MPISITLSDDSVFDYAVRTGAPTGDMLHLVTKRGVMEPSGLPAVALAFDAEVGGAVVRVQHVVSLRELVSAVRAAVAHHETFDPAWQAGDTPPSP